MGSTGYKKEGSLINAPISKTSPIFIACRPTGIIAILIAFTIAILLSNNASAANLIQNGDFETGDFTGWSHAASAVVDGASANSGSYGTSVTGNIPSHAGSVNSIFVYQTVDLTDANTLSFYYAKPSYSPSGDGGCGPALFIDGTKVWHDIAGITSYTYKEWDVSGYSGDTILGFGMHGFTNLGTVSYKICFDDIIGIASAAAPEFDEVSWDQDPYYTGETANITTNILNFDAGTYSYYLDLYNTQEYLTTYEITSETESNYYTFPTEWTDTSLLAKLQRVTDPYSSNEVNLAMDLSHFETLNWDTTVSFNQSSYNPDEILKVTWSGAPTGSTVWLRAMDDGEIIKPNVDYSGSFEFTVPSTTQETYYIADVIVNGVSQAQASCVINLGDYFTPDYIYVTNYSFSDDGTYSLHNVDRAEYLNVTTETNINTDFVDVYYNNVYDDRTVSIDHIENLDGTDQILKFPNDLGSGQYITIIYYHNISTGTQAELSYYTNVGEKGEGIDIYNAVITLDDTKEIMDIQSIAGYIGNDLVVPFDRIIIFDIYADEIINSTIITEDYRYDGDANYNSTADYHIKRSFLFDVLGLAEIQFEVHNDATNTDDIIKYNVYVQGIDQTDLDGSVVMYWTKSNIEIGGTGLLYFNVSGLTSTPTLTITSTTESNYATTRTLHTNQTGTETVLTDEAGVYTAIITDADGIVYAISTLTITDPTVITDDDIVDTTMQDNTNDLLNSPYLIGLFIMAVFLAIGSTNGIAGTIVTGTMGLGIVCYMNIFPWILLVIEVLVIAALMGKGMINLSGD